MPVRMPVHYDAVPRTVIVRGPAGPTGATGPTGPGVPDGGATGEVLAKASGTDQDTAWTGLGDAAALDVGTGSGTVAAGDDSRLVAAVPGTRTVSAGTGLTGGGDLTANRSLALGSAAVASLALADTAVQPATAALTGTPTAPTAAPGTDTTQIATTAFVEARASTLRGGTP